jgi:hypothetical protein
MAYHEAENPEIQKIVEEFRKYEDEFFKRVTTLSEGYPVYLLKRNGSMHRISLDLTI